MSNQASPSETTFGMRELGELLWAHRWLLLVCAFVGLGWGLVNYPPGQQLVQSEIVVEVLPPPSVASLQDLDLWHVLAVTAGLDPQEKVGRDYVFSARIATGRIEVALQSEGDNVAPHDAALQRLKASFKPASDVVTDIVQSRLDVLRTLEVAPAAQYLVVQEAFALQLYLDNIKARPSGVMALEKRTIQVRPKTGLAAYLRYVLIALAGGTAASILLHLLRLLLPGRSNAAQT